MNNSNFDDTYTWSPNIQRDSQRSIEELLNVMIISKPEPCPKPSTVPMKIPIKPKRTSLIRNKSFASNTILNDMNKLKKHTRTLSQKSLTTRTLSDE